MTLLAFAPSPFKEGSATAKEAGTTPDSVAISATTPSETLPVDEYFFRFFTQEISDDFFKTEHAVWLIESNGLRVQHVSC
jgi:hypothetical protein